ncbi:MAG: hypothetical protein GY679_00535 [Mycoplasma sp.]|nr:hypothetical protein [Mycoplasma sp.]
MSKINIKKLEEIAYTLKLKPSKDVLDSLRHDSEEIIKNLNMLKEIDVTNIEPMFRIDEKPILFLREDIIEKTFTPEQVIKNSDSSKGNFITITKVVK